MTFQRFAALVKGAFCVFPAAHEAFFQHWVLSPWPPTSTLTPDSGPGVAYGKAFVISLREYGVSGAGILRPLIDDLNARAAMSPFDKATAARVACNAQDTPNWGAGPVVAMPNGDLIVTARMVAREGPVLVVEGAPPRPFDTSDLGYMRDLMVDPDGSLWIAGWNKLLHLRDTPQGWKREELVAK